MLKHFAGLPVAICVALLVVSGPRGAVAEEATSATSLIKALSGSTSKRIGFGAQKPDANAPLIKSLKEKSGKGLSISEGEAEQLASVAESQPSIDLEINFDYNSDAVSERSRPVLIELGKALGADELRNSTFLVAGHTDRKGGAKYNRKLSERRAKAVKDFIVERFSIPADRLLVAGYGADKLKNKKRPNSEENRRVQIVNVGPSVTAGSQ